MRIILVPGFWLDAASWDGVAPALRSAGHDVEALTLPGLESDASDRASVTLQDQVEAVVDRVDAAATPVVLVGHSGGGSVIAGAADARPDRVARAIYVDSKPAGEGDIVSDEFEVVNGAIPFPGWDAFGEDELADMDDAARADLEARAIPEPARVASDPLHVSDERRYDVPTTVITTSMPSDDLRRIMDPGHAWYPYARELATMHDVTIVDLPTGHWPQLTKPSELAAAILEAIDRA